MENFAEAVENLVAEYQRQPHQSPETIKAHLPSYLLFIEAAVAAGWSGPDMGLGKTLGKRSPEWVAKADLEDVRLSVHTTIRADNANPECPCAILEALQGGQLEALAARLDGVPDHNPEDDMDDETLEAEGLSASKGT